jgi:hypothetical protein
VSGELDIFQPAARVEFHSKMNLVAARWVIAMHQNRSVSEISKIPRASRMIENDFLVKLFEFRNHEKKRTAA